MSATTLAGEFVSPSEPRATRPNLTEVGERGFRASSWDLLGGADVFETEMDTLPGELIDEFSKPVR